MISDNLNEDALPLSDFVELPTTVDFQAINSDRFRAYISDKPYIMLGTELANNYVVGYTNEKNIQKIFTDLGSDFVTFYPKILSPLGSKANDAAGITRVLEQPFLDLTGRGVIIGFIDTGIDYTAPSFRYEDGSTKILSIWDQTATGERTDGIYYGAVYNVDKINEALLSGSPYSIVPETDESGHGTFLASAAAGNEKGEYAGAAPGAGIIAVKLRRARQYYIDQYLLPADEPDLYEATDFILGVKYILDAAYARNMPAVICIGMGSNSVAHDGNTLLEDYISFASQRAGIAFVTAAGNEANARHHTQGKIPENDTVETISINVGKQGESFTVYIFGPAFDKLSLGIVSPTGEVIPRAALKSGLEYSEKLVLEDTTIYLKFYKDVNNNIIVGFRSATEGIWEIKLFGDSIVSGEYWAWLPIRGQVGESVEFLKPVPEYTIVYPATAMRAITCGAYNSDDNSLYVSSSWGPTRLPRPAPDFVAPGVGVKGAMPGGYGSMTGTSAAAAVASGAAALLMEWGVVRNNLPAMDGDLVRSLLISGCTREAGQEYPNVRWGYGKLNLYGSFLAITENNINFQIS